MRNTKWLKNGKFRKAILSAFYNISQRNFGILLILWCSFKLWWNFCLDQNFSYKGKGPLVITISFSNVLGQMPQKSIISTNVDPPYSMLCAFFIRFDAFCYLNWERNIEGGGEGCRIVCDCMWRTVLDRLTIQNWMCPNNFWKWLWDGTWSMHDFQTHARAVLIACSVRSQLVISLQ